MKYLKIQNNGLLDVRLISLIGGTTKDNDATKIGQWGSGLKYTLPYLLKNNIDFKVFVGEQEIKIETRPEIIRDEPFDVIWINNRETSITTKMGGKAWQPWMIIRELWCNALDEGGEHREVTDLLIGEENKTTFYIQIDIAFQEVLNNWGDYFVHDQTPIFQSEWFKIYPGGDSLRIYKNGVLIKSKPVKSLFSYDYLHADINELREFNGSVEYPIVRALANANETVITQFMEGVTESHFEGTMSYDWYTTFGKIWKDTIGNAKIIHQEALNTINDRGIEIDLASTILVPKNVYKFLTKQFTGIGVLRMADKVNEFYEIHSQQLSDKLNEALAILDVCEYSMHPELKFIFGAFGDKNIQAKVSLDKKEVYLSEQLAEKSLFNFISTLVEENEHFKTGFGDCSRQFQQHFIDLFTKTMLDKNTIKL